MNYPDKKTCLTFKMPPPSILNGVMGQQARHPTKKTVAPRQWATLFVVEFQVDNVLKSC